MKIELVSLRLENFKGTDSLDLHFNGSNASIYGDNAAGKSTVYDGLTWLLFGKDSLGRKDFDIKPLNFSGQVRDHSAVTAVEASLRADGIVHSLRRTYYEVWAKRRGSSNASFDGHASDFFFDGVPVKKSEFTQRVGELVEENAFRLLTSLAYFPEKMPWLERRAVLFDLAGSAPDGQIMAADPRFDPLAAAVGSGSLEDLRKKLAARRKSLNGVRNDTPARLDECRKTVAELSSIDFAALEQQLEQARFIRDQARAALDAAEAGNGKANVLNRLAETKNLLTHLENENTAFRLQQAAAVPPDESDSIRRRIGRLEANKLDRERRASFLQAELQQLDAQVNDLRTQWSQANAEQFSGGTCPTCGQTLPTEQLNAAKEKFEAAKASRKQAACDNASRCKAAIDSIQTDLTRLEQDNDREQAETADLSAQLAQLEARPRTVISNLADYDARKADLENQKNALLSELAEIERDASVQQRRLRDGLRNAELNLESIREKLARKDLLERASRRETELRQQAKKAEAELAEVDNLLDLCQEFLRFKAKFLEERVNSKFSIVRFRLFRNLINGGLEDCCDVTVNGVPYSSGLNEGAKVNAGLDIINVLSQYYGVQVPLFVDNAERVTRLIPASTQVIRLVVSEPDKSLRLVLDA